MATSDYGSISQRTAAWATSQMLAHAEPILVLQKFMQTKPLPKNTADNIKFRRPVPFTVSTVALTEGVTPTAQALTYVDVPVTIAQYGAVTEITDKVADLAEDPVLKDASMLSGEQAAETLEMLTYGVAIGGTNVFYDTAAHGARNTVDSVITLNRQRAIVRGLKGQRGKPLNMMLSGSVNYNTSPIEGGYIAFAHTDVEADIRAVTGFIPTAQYGSRQPLCPEEVGSIEGVRYILSPLFVPWADAGGTAATNNTYSTTGTSADVFPVIYMAKDAMACIPLKGANSIKPTVLNPGTPSKSDPLGQKGFVGWKAYFAAVRLNELWMARLEVAVSDI
jgi:N4-gp56 family major capsid protein